MASRPTVSIIGKDGAPTGATHAIPAVFTSPIRPDIVQQVHTGIAKNKRQPYAVSQKAGHQVRTYKLFIVNFTNKCIDFC
jgi:large subunit ribosomal protein L4e